VSAAAAQLIFRLAIAFAFALLDIPRTECYHISGGGAVSSVDLPVLPLILALTLVSTVFALWFYRHARALWAGILFLTGSVRED
jgi:hypothetical protein